MVEEQVIVNKTLRANSREFGSSKDRFKIYFEDAEDLERQIEALKKKGFNMDALV